MTGIYGKVKSQIFAIIQPAENGNLASKIFDIFIMVLIFITIASIFIVTFDFPPELERELDRIEKWALIAFTVEYLLRIWTADLLYPGLGPWYSGNNALGDNVEKIKRLDIHTGDEVENLYKAFTKMTEDTMGYVDKIVSSAEHIAQINSTFGKVVSPQVRDFLLSDNPDLGGQDLEVTVMFCDIRGFTSISERLEPQEIVSMLNRYFTRLEKPIVENGGIINKYIGDAIMAVFGVPLQSKTHAYDAWKAAQGMRAELAAFNEEIKKEGRNEIRFGIGLCSGTVLAGNIGTANRLEYTVIGDTVNTASRIESLCKTYKTDLLISEQTKELLPDDVSLTFIAESEIRGKEKKIKLYS